MIFFFSSSSSLRSFFCGHSCIQKAERKLYQNPGTHRCAGAVHNINVFIIRRRDHGALICAGKFGCKGNNNGGFLRLPDLFKFLYKGVRRCLTGGGQHIALDELFIKCSIVDGHAINVFLLPEMNGEGNRRYPCFDLRN